MRHAKVAPIIKIKIQLSGKSNIVNANTNVAGGVYINIASAATPIGIKITPKINMSKNAIECFERRACRTLEETTRERTEGPQYGRVLPDLFPDYPPEKGTIEVSGCVP